ncbi:MAG: NAD(P)H-dependent oxidoreductase subunit E [Actinomycetota bacterium]|nr:NAD(P)H-dependent oxidoreductase subunit E [Actinomycetota bacterium]
MKSVERVLGEPDSMWSGAGERSPADDHVAYGGFRHATDRRHLLLPALHAVQDSIGWVSHGALNYIAQRIPVSPAEAYGVATFYDLIATEQMPSRVARVCDDIACISQGANQLIEDLEARIGPSGVTNGEEGAWIRSACLGHCEKGSAAFVQRAGDTAVTIAPATVGAIVAALTGAAPHAAAPVRLQDHALPALAEARVMGSAAVRREIATSRIRGRGGAAFPVGVKWEAVASASGDTKYVVCNADESEPGTFKDRHLIETDPFAVIEGLAIAGFAVGATKGYVYIRGEYREAEQQLAAALETAGDIGFDIEIRRGAGAYICGEETALFNSIEGFRGEPRQKPPFPTVTGLFGAPTVVNNVETLAAVPKIVLEGGAAFAARGTAESAGTKLFCISGNVRSPGVHEVEFGATVRELIGLAGGVEGHLQAVLTGGAAGTFVTELALDTPLTFEDAPAGGASVGSGAIVVFNSDVDLGEIVSRIAEFFSHESCGLCVPCRVGTVRQHEAVLRLTTRGGDVVSDLATVKELGVVMRDTSMCGLGQAASIAVESAIALGLIGGDR